MHQESIHWRFHTCAAFCVSTHAESIGQKMSNLDFCAAWLPLAHDPRRITHRHLVIFCRPQGGRAKECIRSLRRGSLRPLRVKSTATCQKGVVAVGMAVGGFSLDTSISR